MSRILLILLVFLSILSSGCFLPFSVSIISFLCPKTPPNASLSLLQDLLPTWAHFAAILSFSKMLKCSFPVSTSHQISSLINPAGCRTSLLKCLAVSIKCLKTSVASSLTNHCSPLWPPSTLFKKCILLFLVSYIQAVLKRDLYMVFTVFKVPFCTWSCFFQQVCIEQLLSARHKIPEWTKQTQLPALMGFRFQWSLFVTGLRLGYFVHGGRNSALSLGKLLETLSTECGSEQMIQTYIFLSKCGSTLCKHSIILNAEGLKVGSKPLGNLQTGGTMNSLQGVKWPTIAMVQDVHKTVSIHSFIYSFNRYLLKTKNVPDTVLVSVNAKIKKRVPALEEIMFWWGERYMSRDLCG